MTLAWAIIIVAVLFLLDKYHLLKKSLVATAIVALVFILGVAGWIGWHYLDARWEEHQNKVRLAKENALFAQKNECLNLYTGKVHPVNEPGSQTKDEYNTPVSKGAANTPQIKVEDDFQVGKAIPPNSGYTIGGEGWTSIPPGGLTQAADEHWCNSNEVIHERGTPIDQWAIIGETPTIPAGEYHVINGESDSDDVGSATAARLCIESIGTPHCYTATGKDHTFGQNAKVEEVKLSSGGKLLLFTAEDYAGNSGWRTVALLANRGGHLENLLPEISDSVAYRFWNLPDISPMPVFVNAYMLVWDHADPNECRACPHRGRVASYVYNKETGRYVKYDDFVTASKQWSLDSEKAEIVTSLRKAAATEVARHIIVK